MCVAVCCSVLQCVNMLSRPSHTLRYTYLLCILELIFLSSRRTYYDTHIYISPTHVHKFPTERISWRRISVAHMCYALLCRNLSTHIPTYSHIGIYSYAHVELYRVESYIFLNLPACALCAPRGEAICAPRGEKYLSQTKRRSQERCQQSHTLRYPY